MLAELSSKFYSLIVGGLFMLVVYHLLLYIQQRKSIYLYYSLYMFFLSLYVFSSNFKDVLGNTLLIYNGLFLFVSYAFYFKLVRSVLNTDEHYPLLNILLKYGAITLSVVSPIFPFISIYISHNAFIATYDALAVVLAIYSLIVYTYLFKINTTYARYLIVGSLFYFICSMIVLFTGIFIGTNGFLERFGFQVLLISYVGILLEALIFASLIGYKTKETELEKITSEANYTLEKQKVITLFKEQELITINAMVEGQEKERQRLAGELHDNLGSTLATVRMQVENLERNLHQVEDPKSLLSKTHQLINEAYDKVRRISHERNAGVLAKEGLLPAVERLARTVSASGNIEVEVQEYGLEKRLSNELEITIFRIIQELTTNIVKHAKATEATIALTQHDNELNIMVEDNGQGFKAGKLIEKDGIGLGSIERRIEHLEGTMEVDSAPGNGTSIIIDIPLT